MITNKEGNLLQDSLTMFIRSFKLSLRSPEAVTMAIIVPAVLMIIFIYVFGGAMNVGDISVINFIVPGIILQTVGQNMPSVAVKVNNDVRKGVVDRFRTMPIAKSSILIGHVLSSVVQSFVVVTVTLITAFLVGFRPQAGLVEWLIAIGLLLLYVTMMTWLGVIAGVNAKDPESAAGFMAMIGVLPFLSSGFVPTETMPAALRIFANHQPMTPVINAIRALLLNQPIPDGQLMAALLWCIGLIVVLFLLANFIFNRKTA